MLDLPQEPVGGRRAPTTASAAIQPSACSSASMSSVRDAAQARTAAAEDQLLGLDEELDLADAAAPELHVMAGHDDLGMAPHGVDLPLHGVDVGDRARSRNICAR